jgi:cell division initiation protein
MIDLTPLDVRKKKGDFARAMRGYETSAVDSFLDMAADRMEELVRESATLKQRVAELSEAVEGYRKREQAMNEALISAQQLREEVRTQAARESDLVIREARAEAERIVSDARREARDVAESMRRAQAARARFLRGFRGFVERQIEEIEVEEERARDAGWMDAPEMD